MAQWFNRDFFANINLIFRRELVLPRESLSAIWDIDLQHLNECGIRGIAIDVNQTLLPYDSNSFEPRILDTITEMKQSFKLCALSNYVGHPIDDRGNIRSQIISHQLGIPVLSTQYKKPSAKAFQAVIDYFRISPQQCAIVGDRIFTDIVGGNLSGFYTILVKPLKPFSDPLLYVLIPRLIENCALKLYSFFNKLTK